METILGNQKHYLDLKRVWNSLNSLWYDENSSDLSQAKKMLEALESVALHFCNSKGYNFSGFTKTEDLNVFPENENYGPALAFAIMATPPGQLGALLDLQITLSAFQYPGEAEKFIGLVELFIEPFIRNNSPTDESLRMRKIADWLQKNKNPFLGSSKIDSELELLKRQMSKSSEIPLVISLEKGFLFKLKEEIAEMVTEKMNLQLKSLIELKLVGNSDEGAEKYLAMAEVCALTGKKPNTIYGLVAKRKIPSIKKGKLLFPKSEIIAWIEEGRKETIADLEAKAKEWEGRNSKKL